MDMPSTDWQQYSHTQEANHPPQSQSQSQSQSRVNVAESRLSQAPYSTDMSFQDQAAFQQLQQVPHYYPNRSQYSYSAQYGNSFPMTAELGDSSAQASSSHVMSPQHHIPSTQLHQTLPQPHQQVSQYQHEAAQSVSEPSTSNISDQPWLNLAVASMPYEYAQTNGDPSASMPYNPSNPPYSGDTLHHNGSFDTTYPAQNQQNSVLASATYDASHSSYAGQIFSSYESNPAQSAVPGGAVLHRSASAGDMGGYQHRQQQSLAPAKTVSKQRQRGSVSALPLHSDLYDIASEMEVLASPNSVYPPVLSLQIGSSSANNGDWSLAAASAHQGSSNGNDSSNYSYTTFQPSLRPVSSANDIHSKWDTHAFRDATTSGSADSSRRSSLANTGAFDGKSQTSYSAGAGVQYTTGNQYDRHASQSSTSSILSTPELSRQQSSDSFRSPVSDQSLSQGFFPASSYQQQDTATPASSTQDNNEQPIAELSDIGLHEKTAEIGTWARMPARPQSDEEANNLLRPQIAEYLRTANKLKLGERTVVIMTSAIGQKSYGTERRFLVPPPSAFILGASWWTHLPDLYLPDHLRHPEAQRPLQLFTPAFKFAIQSESESPEHTSEWTTLAGKTAAETASALDYPIAGRVVAQKLVITSTNNKGDSTTEAQLTVMSPGLGPETDRTIGTFKSKPIKVVSKPSKKAQGSRSGAHIIHGSTVALYNRLRSQTGSTRFLCVSATDNSFPIWDWTSMTGLQEMSSGLKKKEPTFVARTSAWDSFVIYGVDPSKIDVKSELRSHEAHRSARNGLPKPPAYALPVPADGFALPIHYNQPIILQCVNTGVVSPVMVIRQVDSGSMAFGGGSTDPGTVKTPLFIPSAPGETLGDAVCQLHRLAFEVIGDPKEAYANPVDPQTGFVSGGSYLSCLGDQVGVRQAGGNRVMLGPDRQSGDKMPSQTTLEALPNTSAAGPASHVRSQSLAVGEGRTAMPAPATNDGGKVRKAGRLRSVTSLESPIARPLPSDGRKRGSSTASRQAEDSEELATPSGQVWKQDAGEPGIWNIVTTEITRTTFYIPPMLFDGLTPYRCRAIKCPYTFLTPIPATPLSDMPVATRIVITDMAEEPDQARNMGVHGSTCRLVTIYGQNLGSEWTVWFGDIPSPRRIESPCNEVLKCLEPRKEDLAYVGDREILLVRRDGVIVPTRLVLRQ